MDYVLGIWVRINPATKIVCIPVVNDLIFLRCSNHIENTPHAFFVCQVNGVSLWGNFIGDVACSSFGSNPIEFWSNLGWVGQPWAILIVCSSFVIKLAHFQFHLMKLFFSLQQKDLRLTLIAFHSMWLLFIFFYY